MPLNFYAPHHAYATSNGVCQQENEFRQMVAALHAAGIEVILDVVYNHTCEGDHTGPTYSWKGIDNSSIYMLTGDPQRPFANFSGTGNTLHTSNRAVRHTIVDSLRHWDREMHVDGFRFDLASIFTRSSDGSINLSNPPIINEIAMDAELNDNRLIAEPWDAQGEFQLGKRFPGQRWMQWNSHYRDTLQRFVRGDMGCVAELMTRLYGSDDLFPDDRSHAYQPFLSINYITSHDGFTLYDLVSYNHKRNWANGHDNTDGSHPLSWNCGWEGGDNVPVEVLDLRKQQIKNFVALLMLSNGTPMFRMGDEMLQTQAGNNNPYNQDNETTWLNWDAKQKHADMLRFFQQMIAFRKRHPSICRSRFWRDDVSWHGYKHWPDMSDGSRQLAFFLSGASQGDNDLYVMMNSGEEEIDFGIHQGRIGEWKVVVDTSQPSPDDIYEEPIVVVDVAEYRVLPRSVVVLIR
jgi:glycogen operon protein